LLSDKGRHCDEIFTIYIGRRGIPFCSLCFLYSFFREQRFLRDVYNTEIIYGTLECLEDTAEEVGIAEVDILNTMITAMASTTLFL